VGCGSDDDASSDNAREHLSSSNGLVSSHVRSITLYLSVCGDLQYRHATISAIMYRLQTTRLSSTLRTLIRPAGLMRATGAARLFASTRTTLIRARPNRGFTTLTTDKYSQVQSDQHIAPIFSQRTHECGQLRASDVDKRVILCGWVSHIRQVT
jgi:hypothetical protein